MLALVLSLALVAQDDPFKNGVPLDDYPDNLPAGIVDICKNEGMSPRECSIFSVGLLWRDAAFKTRLALEHCKNTVAAINEAPTTPTVKVGLTISPLLAAAIGVALIGLGAIVGSQL